MSVHHDAEKGDFAPARVAPSRADASPISYHQQIDTLRAIAIGSVVIEHYLPYQFEKLGLIDGVMMFFAISGFLITSILLDYRGKVERGQSTLRQALATFYARRALRIFPAYYLLLFVLLFAGAFAREGNFLWHLTYTSNIWMALENRWDAVGGHFWTLSVEEQFYLAWPMLLFLTPRAWLPWTMIGGIAFGIAFNVFAFQQGYGVAAITMPFANFSALFGGALLAWAHHAKMHSAIALLRKYGAVTLLAPLLIYVAPEWFDDIFDPILIAMLSVYLIDQCVQGFRGWLGRLFSLPPVMYIGKISYGIYLYHFVVRYYVNAEWFEGLPHADYVRAAVWTLISIGIAMVSWHAIEHPINSLKGRFKLGRRSDHQAPMPAV